MITRVTHQAMTRSAQQHLQSNLAQLARLQDQASSQKAASRPSDNPSAAADSLRVRAELRAAEQHGRNIADGNGWLTAIDSALSGATDIMNRVRDLTLLASNDASLSPAGREGIAVELESLREDLLRRANTTYQGRTVFAGTSDAGAAFGPDLAYTGGGSVERRIGAGTTVRVDADGAAVFGAGADSAFALVSNIVNDIRSGANPAAQLAAVDGRLDSFRAAHAEAGTRHARILQAQEANMTQSVSLEARRAEIEDVDLAQVILDMKLQEAAYQSSLAVTARVLQPSLMEFLR